jgi:SAM-dependent methyltransferase
MTTIARNEHYLTNEFANFDHVASSVQQEVSELQAVGFDVELVNTPDEYRPDEARQAVIDAKIAELETAENGPEAFRAHGAIADWAPLTKRAIALHTLYNPEGATVGEGIDLAVYDVPLFSGKSAKEVLYSQYPDNPEKPARFIAAYEQFVPAVIEPETEAITARDFFRGVKDAEAVRTRATTAMELVAEHIESSEILADRADLVSASLACGAAGPVYKMVNGLGERGHNFSDVILVDQDPMALATAHSLAEANGVEGKVRLELRDLLTENITDYIKPHSVDVVDLLGLFEYIPNDDRMGHWAAALLGKVKEIVRPGGYIVFGNMLNERPQQDFFKKVVQWPRLQQRTIRQVGKIVEEAGFSANDLQVRVPSEGVYAVYGIKVPHVIEGAGGLVVASVAKDLGHHALERY